MCGKKNIAKQQQEAQEKETQIHTKHKAEGQQAGRLRLWLWLRLWQVRAEWPS